MSFSHKPVLLDETIKMLELKPDGVYVDGTLGGGGHSFEIAKQLETGLLIGIDRDADAIQAAGKRLEMFNKVKFVKDNYKNIKNVLHNIGAEKIDGAVLDLGVSSWQLDSAERGFSYKNNAPLDMRMDTSADRTAYDIVNGYSENMLRDIITKYGEERWAARIAKFIVEDRNASPINSTQRLAELIKAAIPAAARREGGHPAKRTFQAIRIEVNQELEGLEKAFMDFFDCLKPSGRLAVITFHSLEDRIAKDTFSQLCLGCSCPKQLPICVCGNTPKGRLIVKKPVTASGDELEYNSRAKSAKLRGIIKL